MLLLASCASYITSEVSVFENWKNDGTHANYAFYEIYPDNLETRTYQKIVASELSQHGFNLVEINKAQYLIKIDYGSREKLGNALQTIWPAAVNTWPYGCALAQNCFDQLNTWNRWETGPQFINTTYSFEEVFLTLLFIRQSDHKEVYRVLARAEANDLPLVRAMPYLIRSVLQGFPQHNGSVLRVKLPRDLNQEK